jgi:PadR family transcriptional regulator PadR
MGGVTNMADEIFDNWTTQLRKGLLDLCVLNAVGRERLYGYDIVRQLRDIRGLVISEGTIYPILSRFKRDGLVRTSLEESNEGPARKYYELTSAGRDLLGRMNNMWSTIIEGVHGIRSEKGK